MNWLQKIAQKPMALQPGFEEYDTEEYALDGRPYSQYRVPDIIQENKNSEIRSLDGNPFVAMMEDSWGRSIYFMNINNETFLHFTPKEMVDPVLKDGYLRMIKSDSPGIVAVCAVSLTYGQYVAGVQLNARSPEDLVAVVFQTATLPEGGNSTDEVTWHAPVEMVNPRVVSFEEGVALLGQSPVKFTEDDQVAYVNDETMGLL